MRVLRKQRGQEAKGDHLGGQGGQGGGTCYGGGGAGGGISSTYNGAVEGGEW